MTIDHAICEYRFFRDAAFSCVADNESDVDAHVTFPASFSELPNRLSAIREALVAQIAAEATRGPHERPAN